MKVKSKFKVTRHSFDWRGLLTYLFIGVVIYFIIKLF